MKIAILADPIDYQQGGVHVYTRQLVTALAQLDNTNEYFLIRAKEEPGIPGMTSVVIPNNGLGLLYEVLRKFFIIPLWLRKHKKKH